MYRIELAQAGHLPFLTPVELAAAQLYPVEDLPEPLRGMETPAEELLEAQQNGMLWVALDEQATPVGFALVIVVDDNPHLHELDVHPDHGRRGIGRNLVEHVLEWAGANGYSEVTLITFRHLPWNAPFYTKLGFEVVDEDGFEPGIQRLWADEAAEGLDMAKRVVMRVRAPFSLSPS